MTLYFIKKIKLLISLNLIFFFILVQSIPAASLIREDIDGKWFYKCEGIGLIDKVRVYGIKPDKYRVFGLYFSGEISAKNPKTAAAYACGEKKLSTASSKKN